MESGRCWRGFCRLCDLDQKSCDRGNLAQCAPAKMHQYRFLQAVSLSDRFAALSRKTLLDCWKLHVATLFLNTQENFPTIVRGMLLGLRDLRPYTRTHTQSHTHTEIPVSTETFAYLQMVTNTTFNTGGRRIRLQLPNSPSYSYIMENRWIRNHSCLGPSTPRAKLGTQIWLLRDALRILMWK